MARLALVLLSAATLVVAGCGGADGPVDVGRIGSPPAAPTPAPTASPASPTPTPYSAPSDIRPPAPLPSNDLAPTDLERPEPGSTQEPGSTPFPTPGPTITPGSTRVIGTLLHRDGTAAQNVCVVLEKGICPIATDEHGVWFTDIPAGPIHWNFIYRVHDQEVGRQFVLSTDGGELHLPSYVLTD